VSELNCEDLPGRLRDICRGHDKDGNPVLTPEKCERYRKFFLDGQFGSDHPQASNAVRRVATTRTLNKNISCPFLDNNKCNLVQELTGKECPVDTTTCKGCLRTDNPSAVNVVTITLASQLTPEREYDISLLGTGVGTKLASILKPFLSEVKGCGCKGRQDILDLWTPEYIKNNIDRVITWLGDSARKRKIPFSPTLTRYLLLTIIKTM